MELGKEGEWGEEVRERREVEGRGGNGTWETEAVSTKSKRVSSVPK